MQTYVPRTILEYSIPWTKMSGSVPTANRYTPTANRVNGISSDYGPRSFYAENFAFPRTALGWQTGGATGSIDGKNVKIGFNNKISYLGVTNIESSGYYTIKQSSGSDGVRISRDIVYGGSIELLEPAETPLTSISVSSINQSYFFNRVIFGAEDYDDYTPQSYLGLDEYGDPIEYFYYDDSVWNPMHNWYAFKSYFFGGTYADYSYVDYERCNNLDVKWTWYFRRQDVYDTTYKSMQYFYEQYAETDSHVVVFDNAGGDQFSTNITSNLAEMDSIYPDNIRRFNNTNWGYMRLVDQHLYQSFSPTFASIKIGTQTTPPTMTPSMVSYILNIEPMNWPMVATINQKLTTAAPSSMLLSTKFVGTNIGSVYCAEFEYNHLYKMNHLTDGTVEIPNITHDDWKYISNLNQNLGTTATVNHYSVETNSPSTDYSVRASAGGITALTCIEAPCFQNIYVVKKTLSSETYIIQRDALGNLPGVVVITATGDGTSTVVFPPLNSTDAGYSFSLINLGSSGYIKIRPPTVAEGGIISDGAEVMWNGTRLTATTTANFAFRQGATFVALTVDFWACTGFSRKV